MSGENDQDDRNTIDLSILLGLILLRKDQYTHLHERVLLSTLEKGLSDRKTPGSALSRYDYLAV